MNENTWGKVWVAHISWTDTNTVDVPGNLCKEAINLVPFSHYISGYKNRSYCLPLRSLLFTGPTKYDFVINIFVPSFHRWNYVEYSIFVEADK